MIRQVIYRAAHGMRLHRDPVAYFRSLGAEIGVGVEIYGATWFTFGSEPYLIRIGDHVTISHGVDFITHDGGLRVIRSRNPEAYLYDVIDIGERAFLGAHSIYLPGTRVGAGSVIGAGSVVTGEIPPGVVAAGVPARAIKTVEDYVRQTKDRWIDTTELTPGRKRDLLSSRLRHW